MRIVVEQGETAVLDQNFTAGTFYLGRHEQCQIRLTGSDQITGRHLMFFEEKGHWFVEPIHDQFRITHLNGHLLQQRQELHPGDELTIGTYRIKMLADTTQAADKDSGKDKTKNKDKALPFQVIAVGSTELQERVNLVAGDMGLSESVIIKKRTDTFSLSKGRMEYISGLSLRFMGISDVRALLTMVLDTILVDFQAYCVWAGLRTDAEGHLHLSAGKDISGRPLDAPGMAGKLIYATVDCARALLIQVMENNPDRSCMAVPLVSPDGSLGLIYLESEPGKPRFNVADLDTLVFIANQVAMSIDRLLRQQTTQLDQFRTLDQELARKVQARTAPWQLPQWPELQMAVLAEPGTGICTDFYDVLPLGEKQAMVLVGQTPAGQSDTAISIAEMSAAFRIGAVHRDIPQVLMRQMNWLLYTSASEPRRLSCGVIGIDPESGEFCICLAGNVFAYLVGSGGKVFKIRTENNPLVGESRKSKYEAMKGKLGSDQILAICTGGIFSITASNGSRYTEEHLLDFLSDTYGQLPARVLGDLADDVTAFTGGKKPSDDITLLILRKGRQLG